MTPFTAAARAEIALALFSLFSNVTGGAKMAQVTLYMEFVTLMCPNVAALNPL